MDKHNHNREKSNQQLAVFIEFIANGLAQPQQGCQGKRLKSHHKRTVERTADRKTGLEAHHMRRRLRGVSRVFALMSVGSYSSYGSYGLLGSSWSFGSYDTFLLGWLLWLFCFQILSWEWLL